MEPFPPGFAHWIDGFDGHPVPLVQRVALGTVADLRHPDRGLAIADPLPPPDDDGGGFGVRDPIGQVDGGSLEVTLDREAQRRRARIAVGPVPATAVESRDADSENSRHGLRRPMPGQPVEPGRLA
jgi:hypothetical protein